MTFQPSTGKPTFETLLLIMFGSLTPYLLQRFASIPTICNEISNALDTMYRASLPTSLHVHHLIHQLARQHNDLGLDTRHLKPLVAPAILQHDLPMASIRTSENMTTHAKLSHVTAYHAGRIEYHEHHATCKKGRKTVFSGQPEGE